MSASRDGEDWQIIGTLGKEGSVTCDVPPAMLPGRRDLGPLHGASRCGRNAASGPAAPRISLRSRGGRTTAGSRRCHAIRRGTGVRSATASAGHRPGRRDPRRRTTRSRCDSAGNKPRAHGTVDGWRLGRPRQLWNCTGSGATRNRPCRFLTRSTAWGCTRLAVQIRGDAQFTAETTIDVPALHAAHYGQMLPASDAAVGLWWCSSGWKVSSQRPVPSAGTQVGCGPHRRRGQRSGGRSVGRASGPDRCRSSQPPPENSRARPARKIDSQQIDILRVRYVSVTQPTDASSTVGLWPDPLPPLHSALDTGSQSQSAAVDTCPRARNPTALASIAERSRSRRTTTARRCRLQVEVFGFAMPDRMTCQTAFGFDTERFGVTTACRPDEHRRLVLDKYLSAWRITTSRRTIRRPSTRFASRGRICPPGSGGEVDPSKAHTGSASLRVVDESATAKCRPSTSRRFPSAIKGSS